MTSEALRAGLISEQTIRDALVTARGDIFVASGYLSVAPRELDRYIRASEHLQVFTSAISTIKKDVDYDRMSTDQFREQLEHVTRAYRIEATEIIHDLATMSFDTAAMADVKLKAAVQLRGNQNETPVNSSQAQVLAELNDAYRESAPRIKKIRAIEIEYTQEPNQLNPSF